MKIVFMGTPAFSVPFLAALHEKSHEICAVLTQIPRKKGRGHRVQVSPVHDFAQRQGIPVYTPVRLSKDQDVLRVLEEQKPDVIVVVAYGQILPARVLSIPQFGCINVHASLLPRWRGAAPIQRAIEAGDEKSGVCIMDMEEGLDTGCIYATCQVPITDIMTAQDLHEVLMVKGVDLLLDVIGGLREKKHSCMPQMKEGVLYAHRLEKKEAFLDASAPAKKLSYKIRAFYPFPGTFFYFRHTFPSQRIKVLSAREVTSEVLQSLSLNPIREFPKRAGQLFVLSSRLFLTCGRESFLELTQLQRQGKTPLPAKEFLKGAPTVDGDEVLSLEEVL